MSNKPQEERSKMRSLSLNDEEDAALLEIGKGSRTAAVRELMEIHRLVKQLKGVKPEDLKYRIAELVESQNNCVEE